MNKAMDERLAAIKQKKQETHAQQMETSLLRDASDKNSGIILRSRSRVATEDEVRLKANGRVFVSIEEVDSHEVRHKFSANLQSQGFFTIGVLCDVAPPMTSKNGKKFSILKLTDLVKYDLNKVKRALSAQVDTLLAKQLCDKEELALALKAYTPNGYKQMSIMCFGEAALAIQ
jgi:hypothetical protein